MASLLAVAMLLVLISCGGEDAARDQNRGEPQSPQSQEELWGRSFVSVAVTEDGEPRPLVSDTSIELTFEKREGEGGIRWRAGCNIFGSSVEITPERLLVRGQIGGTMQRCRDALHKQDEWHTGFFGSDPRWNLNDERLTLTSERTIIELKESR